MRARDYLRQVLSTLDSNRYIHDDDKNNKPSSLVRIIAYLIVLIILIIVVPAILSFLSKL